MNKRPYFILDISRLLTRAGQDVPTGIDRVELAYAEHLLIHYKGRVHFVSSTFYGKINFLPTKKVFLFIETLLSGWNLGEKSNISRARKIANYLIFISVFNYHFPHLKAPSFYLLLSHHHLMNSRSIRHFLSKNNSHFIPMLHDLIPIEYPEYSRPREKMKHEKRLDTIIKLSSAVIVPTDYVKNSLHTISKNKKHPNVPIWTIPHGIYIRHTPPLKENQHTNKKTHPYFVYLSTIEPRKNHLLLLHLWRRMVERQGKDSVPHLILIGKRGWENENILDMLERSPALRGVVYEESQLPDDVVVMLLKRSNGLLFSSFTEGYGLPLAEAMSLSVPCICADIPALREVGKDIPLYLDPLNTPEWEQAINDFAKKGPLWRKQKEKLANWSPILWQESIETTLSLCLTLK